MFEESWKSSGELLYIEVLNTSKELVHCCTCFWRLFSLIKDIDCREYQLKELSCISCLKLNQSWYFAFCALRWLVAFCVWYRHRFEDIDCAFLCLILQHRLCILWLIVTSILWVRRISSGKLLLWIVQWM